MNTCKNSECRKEIPENLNYCNEECLRKHQEIKREAKSKPQIEESTREQKTKAYSKNKLYGSWKPTRKTEPHDNMHVSYVGILESRREPQWKATLSQW